MFSSSQAQPDYYQLLGINRKATTSEIKTAFRKKAKALHPDKNLNVDTTAQMQAIIEAYKTLSDPSKRANYDSSFNVSYRYCPPSYEYEEERLDVLSLISLVKSSQLDKIKDIIWREKARTSSWKYNKYVKLAVSEAILSKQLDMVEFFLSEGFSPNEILPMSDPSKKPIRVLSLAAKVGYMPVIIRLVEEGAVISFSMDQDDPLENAIEAGHEEVLELFLSLNADPNKIRFHVENGMMPSTYLMKALQNKNQALIRLLLRHGAFVNLTLDVLLRNFERTRFTSNSEKLKENYEQMIQLLLDEIVGFDFSSLKFFKNINIAGFNFIGMSFEGRPISRQLLKDENFIGADKALVSINQLINLQDAKRRNHIGNQLGCRILEQGYAINEQGLVFLAPLWLSAKAGNVKAVKARLEKLVDINYAPLGELSPIVAAAKRGYLDVVTLLANDPRLDANAIIQAIEIALQYDQEEVKSYLLTFKHQLLKKAVEEANLESLAFLLSCSGATSASPSELKAWYEEEILFEAIKKPNNIEFLMLFKTYGADFNIRNKEGETLLIAATCLSDVSLMAYLINHGANINDSHSLSNDTPLHYAAKQISVKKTALLLHLGAKVDALDQDGLTPLQVLKSSFLAKMNLSMDLIAKKELMESYTKTLELLVNQVSYSNTPARFFNLPTQPQKNEENASFFYRR